MKSNTECVRAARYSRK